jgi:hypothetical protein
LPFSPSVGDCEAGRSLKGTASKQFDRPCPRVIEVISSQYSDESDISAVKFTELSDLDVSCMPRSPQIISPSRPYVYSDPNSFNIINPALEADSTSLEYSSITKRTSVAITPAEHMVKLQGTGPAT